MKQKLGIFGLSVTLVLVTFGIFDYLSPAAIQAMVLIATATVILGIYLMLRSMYRESRVLTAYDRSLRERFSEPLTGSNRRDTEAPRKNAEKSN